MNIYYQGNPGSYMYMASKEIEKLLEIKIGDIIGMHDFTDVWNEIGENKIGVLAIENSYMGSIHPNLYGFLKHDYKIIGEYYLEINHCICSKEKNINKIKKAYSQNPALEQCHQYLKDKKIKPVNFSDTALSAKYVSETNQEGIAAICSIEAAKIYGLNILEKNIADNKNNTTRFVLISNKKTDLVYKKKSKKISIIFEAKDIPSSLYKCLGAFATNNINLSKIESLPSYKNYFSYYFWLDFKGNLDDEAFKKAIEELKFFTKDIRILGEY